MLAGEIRELAGRAGIGPGVSVLDACCGVAGPGRLITAEFGCQYLGVDYSASSLEIARELAGDLPCRFHQARIPPLPDDPVEVVLLLETMLAFADKRTPAVRWPRAGTGTAGSPSRSKRAGRSPPASATGCPTPTPLWPIELAELTTWPGRRRPDNHPAGGVHQIPCATAAAGSLDGVPGDAARSRTTLARTDELVAAHEL